VYEVLRTLEPDDDTGAGWQYYDAHHGRWRHAKVAPQGAVVAAEQAAATV
jgi:hypothetical protein